MTKEPASRSLTRFPTEDEQRSSFVGRRDEFDRVLRLLQEGRVTTLVGPAGIGKSRLATEVADCWPGEVHIVSLSRHAPGPAQATDVCVARMSKALGLEATSDRESVGRALSGRSALLVLFDDADRFIEPLADLVSEWTCEAPELRVLTTSRERLRMRRENVVEVPSLSCKGGSQSEAATLLVSAVERVSGMSLDEEDVVQWCEWLDGVPLALELAAARAPFLGRAGDGSRIDALDRGFRDADPRHSTLARAIAWSWEGLDESAQKCLAQSAAFLGPFDVKSATQVLAGEGEGTPSQQLRALVEKSLLRIDARQRLRLDGAVREFVIGALPQVHLDAQLRLDVAIAAHAATAQDGLLPGSFHPQDVLASAERALQEECVLTPNERASTLVLAARLLQAEGPIHRLSSLMHSGIEALCACVGLDPAQMMRLKLASAAASRMQGRYQDAEQSLGSLLESVSESSDYGPMLRAHVHMEAAMVHHARRDLDAAQNHYAHALGLSASPRLLGRLRANLGSVAHDAGDLATAEDAYKHALTALTPIGDERLLGAVRSNLGLLYQERGDLTLAHQTMTLALTELEADRYLGGIHRGNYGQLLLEMGRLVDALREHEAAYAALRRMGDERSMAISLCRLGGASALLGHFAEAQRYLEEAQAYAQRLQDPLADAVVATYRAFIPLGLAEHPDTKSDAQSAYIVKCNDILRSVADEVPEWRYSDDARAARRIVQARLGARDSTAAHVSGEGSDLLVCIESRFFCLRGEAWQDLRGSTAARRILECLIENRRGLELDDLQARVWPRQRIRNEVGKNRVHVALSHLRKRGLKKHIVRVEGRYALRQRLTVRRVESVQPPDGTKHVS